MRAVSCVGNSITRGNASHEPGDGTHSPRKSSARMRIRGNYPAILASLSGGRLTTSNFGHGGRTAVNASEAYVRTLEYSAALESTPQTVVLMLGTNDCKRSMWPQHQHDFVPALVKIGLAFLSLPSQPNLLLVVPPPIINYRSQSPPPLEFQAAVLASEIRPRIIEASQLLANISRTRHWPHSDRPCAPGTVSLLDLHSRWAGKYDCEIWPAIAREDCASLYIADGIHTSERGAQAIAAAVYEELEPCAIQIGSCTRRYAKN